MPRRTAYRRRRPRTYQPSPIPDWRRITFEAEGHSQSGWLHVASGLACYRPAGDAEHWSIAHRESGARLTPQVFRTRAAASEWGQTWKGNLVDLNVEEQRAKARVDEWTRAEEERRATETKRRAAEQERRALERAAEAKRQSLLRAERERVERRNGRIAWLVAAAALAGIIGWNVSRDDPRPPTSPAVYAPLGGYENPIPGNDGSYDCPPGGGPVYVGSSDPAGLDGDGDGWGCE